MCYCTEKREKNIYEIIDKTPIVKEVHLSP